MIIGVDTRIRSRNKTGIGYLISNLFARVVMIDKDNEYRFFGNSLGLDRKCVRVFKTNFIFQRLSYLLFKMIPFFKINFFLGKTDLFIFPDFIIYPNSAKKKILFVPDISFVSHPHFTDSKNLKLLKKMVPRSIKEADKIVTISENAKKEIVSHYDVASEKVEVVHLGCRSDIKKELSLERMNEVKSKYGINRNYILYLGTIEPRKNIKNLIEAYDILPDEIKKSHLLVIAGGKGWYYDEVFDLVKKKGLSNDIIFTDYLPEDEIPSIYSAASVFVFPSFYEGFGLPILEAMACGVPVVTSNTSSLPEVGGEAAVYFDPYDISGIRDSIVNVLTNKELRSSLIKLGEERVGQFSWDKAAQKLLSIINSLKC